MVEPVDRYCQRTRQRPGAMLSGPLKTATPAALAVTVRAGPVSSEASCAYLRAEVERLGRDARAAGLPDTLRSTLEGQWGQARARAKAGGC